MVQSNITRLNRLISDLLDLSKIEAGKFELNRTEIDLAEVIEQVAGSFAPALQERGLSIKTEIACRPVRLLVDADKIVQVLTNLINNAMKFTREGSITVKLDATDALVHCAVQDTGIGIPAEKLSRVFGKFQQFGAAIRGEKGTGLGLSLCKSLVETHEGTIAVESTAGVGTTFKFSLPRLRALHIFDEALQRLYEVAASAGQCLSAFILELADGKIDEPFEGKLAIAIKLEDMCRLLLRTEQDLVLREGTQIYFVLNGMNKPQAKAVVEKLVADLIPVAEAAAAVDRIVLRVQYTSLPDDGTTLEGLQARLAA
jgi:two-component sensor histidine kinase